MYNKDMHDRVLKLRKHNLSISKIARILNIAKSTISNWLNKNGKIIPVKKVISKSNQLLINLKISNSLKNSSVINNKRKPIHELKSIGKIRLILFSKRGRKCEICGWNEINIFHNIIPVQLHHKDGNKDNNYEDNLVILCPNCHSLTETFMFYGQTHKHIIKHKTVKDIEQIELKCAFCGSGFNRRLSYVRSKQKNGQKDFYCNRSCAGRHFGGGRDKTPH